MEINGNNNSQQNSAHHCQCCNYNTIHKSDFIKHEKSKKHLLKSQGINETQQHICSNCNKSFLSRSGLWKHQQKCSYTVKEPSNTITSEMFMEFFKQSTDLQNILVEQNRDFQNTIIEQNKEHHKQIMELSKIQSSITTINFLKIIK
jgi:ribosomal protein L37AE/L43A